MHLVEEPSVVDPTYIEDFLLTYRTFLSNPMEVGKKLLEWFHVDSLRDTVNLFALVCAAGFGHFGRVCTVHGWIYERLCKFPCTQGLCVCWGKSGHERSVGLFGLDWSVKVFLCRVVLKSMHSKTVYICSALFYKCSLNNGPYAPISTPNYLYSCMSMELVVPLTCRSIQVQPAQLSLNPAAICSCLTLPLSITALT